jgi:hypothetical protein
MKSRALSIIARGVDEEISEGLFRVRGGGVGASAAASLTAAAMAVRSDGLACALIPANSLLSS